MIKRTLLSLLPIAFMTGCATTPFSFEGENANKGYVVLSLSVSEICRDTGRFDVVSTGMSKINGDAGRPFNLRNPFAFPDFEEDETLFYSFGIEEGEYVFDRISGVTKLNLFNPKGVEYGSTSGLQPYKVSVKAGEVNYLGNLYLVGMDSKCNSPEVKFTYRDRKKRDLKKAAESQPHLFAFN